MKEQHGDFAWYELMTKDPSGSKKFYSGLYDWEFRQGEQEGYELFFHDDLGIGGLLPLTKEMLDAGAIQTWAGYISVDDVDELVNLVEINGGHILVPPQIIPNVGRFAYIQDPQGANVYVLQSFAEEQNNSFSPYEPKVGHCSWNELVTTDLKAAEEFYGNVFGWTRGEAMDMGPAGEYVMLRNGEDRDFLFGAMMQKPDDLPSSMWSFYFRTKSIDRAIEYTKTNGGKIMMGPDALPDGDNHIFWGIDPQDALFACIGHK